MSEVFELLERRREWSRRWKALAKSYRQRHVWNGEIIHRQDGLVRLCERSARRWKTFAKAVWRQHRASYVALLRARRAACALLECEGCGLRNTSEPTVRLRLDGHARCGNCSAQWEGWRPPRGRELEWREWLK